MTSATAVAKTAPAQVPDLVRTPALELTAEDVALPRIYLGQFSTTAVKDQLVKPGCIFTAAGPDDPDPSILWSEGDKQGVLLHVLSLRKGKSVSEGGELQLYDYDDPAAPPEAWVTYNYTVALPDVDPDVPYRILLTKSGRPAALQINTALKKTEGQRPAYAAAFRLTTTKRENTKGEWFVPRVSVVEADDAHVKLAESLFLMISGSAPELRAAGEEPAI